MNEYQKEIRKNNINKYYADKSRIKKQIASVKKTFELDKINSIINSLSRRANDVLRKQNIKLECTHLQLIGCTKEELKNHLLMLFKDDMSFNNYGEWELDHIMPVSSFNLHNNDELFKCFNYKNVQPLWKTENRKKYNKIPET